MATVLLFRLFLNTLWTLNNVIEAEQEKMYSLMALEVLAAWV